MDSNLAPVFGMAVFFGAIVLLVKIISDNRLRQKLVEKGIVDENVKYLYAKRESSSGGSLKWGIFLVAIGAALMIIRMAPHVFYDESAFGLLMISGGVALFAHYFIAKRFDNQDQPNV